jgi:hypothetical protein
LTQHPFDFSSRLRASRCGQVLRSADIKAEGCDGTVDLGGESFGSPVFSAVLGKNLARDRSWPAAELGVWRAVRSWLAMAEKADQTTVPMWLGSDDSLHAVPVRAAICRGRRGAHRWSWPDPGQPELGALSWRDRPSCFRGGSPKWRRGGQDTGAVWRGRRFGGKRPGGRRRFQKTAVKAGLAEMAELLSKNNNCGWDFLERVGELLGKAGLLGRLLFLGRLTFGAKALPSCLFTTGTLGAMFFVAGLQRSSELLGSQLRSSLRLRAACDGDRSALVDHCSVLGNKFGGHLQTTLDRAQVGVCGQRTELALWQRQFER